MKRMELLLNLSGEFEPFIPSVHLCSLSDSMAVLAGLDTLTRQAAAPALAKFAAPAPTPAPVVVATAPIPASQTPTVAATAPSPVYSSRRKEYLPALQDPQLIAALLAGAPRSTVSKAPLATPARKNSLVAPTRTTPVAPSASPQTVRATPKPRPFGSEARRGFTVPILKGDAE